MPWCERRRIDLGWQPINANTIAEKMVRIIMILVFVIFDLLKFDTGSSGLAGPADDRPKTPELMNAMETRIRYWDRHAQPASGVVRDGDAF